MIKIEIKILLGKGMGKGRGLNHNIILMKIVERIENLPRQPSVVTIGNFDGVHLGHQAVLSRLSQIALTHHLQRVVITFSNHPSEVLHPNQNMLRLCTLDHKIRLLEQAGTDILLLLTFTKEFSQQSAHTFLQHVHQHLPFSHLILGYDAAFGHGKEGDRNQVQKSAHILNFIAEYEEPFLVDGVPVSSTLIRSCINNGDFSRIKKLLGRDYSIYGKAIHNVIDITKLCVPPAGTYAVSLLCKNKVSAGTAMIDDAQLKILFDDGTVVSEEHIEVIFDH